MQKKSICLIDVIALMGSSYVYRKDEVAEILKSAENIDVVSDEYLKLCVGGSNARNSITVPVDSPFLVPWYHCPVECIETSGDVLAAWIQEGYFFPTIQIPDNDTEYIESMHAYMYGEG